MLRSPGNADETAHRSSGTGSICSQIVETEIGDRSFRPRYRSFGENAFGSADSRCGHPPRVPRRFAVAFVGPPWAAIGPPRLGLFGDFVASYNTVNILKLHFLRDSESTDSQTKTRINTSQMDLPGGEYIVGDVVKSVARRVLVLARLLNMPTPLGRRAISIRRRQLLRCYRMIAAQLGR